eukprot:1683023-Prymnesium_polylepis.1
MQRMSDLRTSRSACPSQRWVNETCWMEVEWQAVAAAGLLAVDDFNARDGRYVPAFAGTDMRNCDKKLTASVYDSVCPADSRGRCLPKVSVDMPWPPPLVRAGLDSGWRRHCGVGDADVCAAAA